MLKKTTQFKQLLYSNQIEFLMEAHNGISAKIVEETGFKGIWGSGLSISAALGVRDNNEASWTQILEMLEFMSDATYIPILVDADTGYGNFNNVRRLVRKLEQRQVAAMCIEDKLFPKTNSFIGGESQPLADIVEFSGKIKAAKDTQQDPDFCVIARVEAFIAGWGLSEALRRAEAYHRAGADAILMHSKKSSADEVLAFMKAWKNTSPVVIVPTMYYNTPTDAFEAAGISLVIWANHLVRSSITAMQQTAKQIYRDQSLRSVEHKIIPVKEIFRLQGAAELKAAESEYLPQTDAKHSFKSLKTNAFTDKYNEQKTIAAVQHTEFRPGETIPHDHTSENGAPNDKVSDFRPIEEYPPLYSPVSGTKPPYAIVIGLDTMTGLQTARILAKHKIPVIGIAADPSHYSCQTKVCERIIVANTGSSAFIRELETLGPQLKDKAVLFPCTDDSVLLLSRSRRQLKHWFHIMLPQSSVVEMLMDKVKFYTYAQESGLLIPGTFLLNNRAEAEEAAAILSFPCILKPPYKSPTWLQYSSAKAYKVANAEEFLALYDRCSRWAETLIVQEWVEGPDSNLFSCNCYFSKIEELVITFVARKLRQWPPETGTSSLGEEIRNDAVLDETVRLFGRVNFQGLGYVEMKCDQRTGKHYIIEPNIGRPTGRSAIAEAGGVELLYTMYCDAVGWPLPENRDQTYHGIKWIYWRQDVLSALHYWRRGELTLKEWWQSLRGRKRYAVFSWTDPAPFLADFRRNANRPAHKRKRYKK